MNKGIYQQVIIDHNKNPRNYGKIENITHGAEGYNPLCGDHIFIDLIIKKNICNDISFRGESCSICKSCASLLTDEVKGKSVDQIKELIENFNQFILKENKDGNDKEIGKKLIIFSNVWNYPARVKCALLPVKTIKLALDNKITSSSQDRESVKTE